jgi:hypothetical protein
MSKVRAWLQLFRVPNLFTVPGDPLAGFLIATGGRLDERVVPAIVACLFLYMAGLVLNDLADYQEDLQDRPQRPLPSGAIPRGAAWIVAGNLVIFGLGFCFMVGRPVALMGVGVLMGVVMYNFLTKRIPVIGALNMGVCRGLSLLVGAAAGAAPDPLLLSQGDTIAAITGFSTNAFALLAQMKATQNFFIAIGAALLVAVYIAAVTNLARFETRPVYPRLPRFLPLLSLLVGFVLLKEATDKVYFDSAASLWLFGFIMAMLLTAELMKEPPPRLAPRIGAFIRILPVLQAALCLAPSVAGRLNKTPASLLCAFALLLCVPLHAWLGKKFYAS